MQNITLGKLKTAGRAGAFDWARIFLCLLVVVWHSKLLGMPSAAWRNGILTPADIFYYNVTLIAVPSFLMMSGWLVYEKIGNVQYLSFRARRFFAIFVFWSFAWTIIFRVSPFCEAEATACYWRKLMTGNDAYDTYYLLILIQQDFLLFVLVSVERQLALVICTALLLLFVSTCAFAFTNRGTYVAAFYSPLSFCAIPAVVYMTKNRTKIPLRWWAFGLGAIGLIAAAIEWWLHFRVAPQVQMPNYARVSAMCLGGAIIFSLAEAKLPQAGSAAPLVK